MSKNFGCSSCGETNNGNDLPCTLKVPEEGWGGAKQVNQSNSAYNVVNFTLRQPQETDYELTVYILCSRQGRCYKFAYLVLLIANKRLA
jgi:hypothetical protein